jgi:hypothetical protein
VEVALEEFFQLTVSKTVKEVYLTDMYLVQVLVQQAFLQDELKCSMLKMKPWFP